MTTEVLWLRMSCSSMCIAGAGHDQLMSILKQLGRSAFVSPVIDGVTIVADRACGETLDIREAEQLAETLASELNCSILNAMIFAGDLLYMSLRQPKRDMARFLYERVKHEGRVGVPLSSAAEFAERLHAVFAAQGRSLQQVVEQFSRSVSTSGVDGASPPIIVFHLILNKILCVANDYHNVMPSYSWIVENEDDLRSAGRILGHVMPGNDNTRGRGQVLTED